MFKNNKYLFIFLTTIISFTIIGLIFIYSSSSIFALEKFGSTHYFIRKQLIGCAIGFFCLLICRYLPIEHIKFFTPILFVIAIFLTAIPIISNFRFLIHGSSRWINFFGISFQPSEFLKTTFILYIAHMIAKKKHLVNSLIYGYIPLLLIVTFTAIILLKQPDFGQTITFSITAFLMFFIAECQLKHIAYTFGFCIPIISILILIKPYRINRILTFLNPWSDPLGSGFQIIQSLIAIGSGHITGVGIAQSRQKFFYLPMQHTDFIFSIIAEETGFIGSLIIISLYTLFLYAGIKISKSLKDKFEQFSTLGFVCITTLQAIINLSVASGLFPTKGLGLPFISYGNSALIFNFCMVGLILNFYYNNDGQATLN